MKKILLILILICSSVFAYDKSINETEYVTQIIKTIDVNIDEDNPVFISFDWKVVLLIYHDAVGRTKKIEIIETNTDTYRHDRENEWCFEHIDVKFKINIRKYNVNEVNIKNDKDLEYAQMIVDDFLKSYKIPSWLSDTEPDWTDLHKINMKNRISCNSSDIFNLKIIGDFLVRDLEKESKQ